jgi:hypothetical protein
LRHSLRREVRLAAEQLFPVRRNDHLSGSSELTGVSVSRHPVAHRSTEHSAAGSTCPSRA